MNLLCTAVPCIQCCTAEVHFASIFYSSACCRVNPLCYLKYIGLTRRCTCSTHQGSSGGHYGDDAFTYMNVGEAMGEAMVMLLKE